MKQIITAIEVVSMLRPVYFFILRMVKRLDSYMMMTGTFSAKTSVTPLKTICDTNVVMEARRCRFDCNIRVTPKCCAGGAVECRCVAQSSEELWGTQNLDAVGRATFWLFLICDIFDPIFAISRISPIFNFWVEAIVRCMRFLQDGPLFWMWNCKHKTTM